MKCSCPASFLLALCAGLVLFTGCAERARAAEVTPSGPKARFVLKVEHGTFPSTLDTRLEAELVLALAHQADLEVISFAVAERALLRQRVCDPERDFAACRRHQLGLAGDFVVELEMGVVPGTWALTTSATPAEGTLSWLPTLPFSQQRGESLEEAVARTARLLGASLGPAGLRPGTLFPPVKPISGSATALSRLCPGFNAPWIPSGELAWQTRTAVRAQLHQVGREPELESILAELAEASKPGAAHCVRLAAIVAWQERAVSRGWLPAELRSEGWRANVEILLGGPAASQDVGNSLAGAFAARGFSLHSLLPAPQPCLEGSECIEGISSRDVGPALWVLAVDVGSADGKLSVAARLLVPDGARVRAVALPRVEAASASALRPAVDDAVAHALKQVLK